MKATTTRRPRRKLNPVVTGAPSEGITISIDLAERVLEALGWVTRPDGPHLARDGSLLDGTADVGPTVDEILHIEAELRQAAGCRLRR